MLANRLQSTSSLLLQSQFSFATKNLKQIKIRMKAVESIKKITKAMKMVAAAKMKQDVSRLERAKTYGVGTVQRIINNETYLAKKKAAFTAKKWLLVPITSDKGLCGGVNSSVIREIKAMVKADRSAYKIFVVGDKGSVALSRPMGDILESAITHPSTPMNFPTAASIAYQVIEHAKDCDRVTIIFNEFKNVISQFQRKVEVLNKTEFVQQFKFVTKHDPDSMSQHADLFYDFYISAAFYNALLNNIASETSSRMNAMENASKNAGEILDSLTLEYNKARQAKITMELCEIISDQNQAQKTIFGQDIKSLAISLLELFYDPPLLFIKFMQSEKIEQKSGNNKNQLLAELMEMGFEEAKISEALSMTSNKQQAINIILNGAGNLQANQDEDDFEDDEEDYKMIFVVRNDLKLPLCKIAEFVATAALKAYQQMEAFVDVDELKEYAFFEWSQGGQRKIVVKAQSDKDLLELIEKAKKSNINYALVYEHPSNFKPSPNESKKIPKKQAMIEQKSEQSLQKQPKQANPNKIENQILILGAFGPASESEIDPLTKHFKLL